MTNEFENETFGNTSDPQEPAKAEETQTASIFEKTVFGSAQPSAAQSAPEPQAAQTPVADSETTVEPDFSAQAEPAAQTDPAPQAEEPTVQAERLGYDPPPVSAYRTQQTVPPYGRTTVPPYGQQNTVPPYGQTARPQGVYGTQPTYGAQAYTAPANAPEKKSKKGLKVFFTVIALIVLAGVMFGVGIGIGGRHRRIESATSADTQNSTQANAPEMQTQASPASDSSAVPGAVLTPTQIAAKVRSSSVGILVYSSRSSEVASEGSGVLWKEDDTHTYTYIITCAHVVNGTGLTYTVQTEDGSTYDAEVVGADSKTDLAVLRIKARGLSLAEFGDSSKLQVGDPVYAIGNPGGTEFFGSFTSGIVSAIDRSVKSTYTMVCIQHTAAINPGNSGGALVNQYGQVVGINSQKIIDTQYEGMGFSIPIKSAQSIINSLATYGYVANRAKLGITYAEAVNYQQYSMLIKIKGLPSGSLIITDINEDSSLAKTDVKQYDMIIKVNGEELTKPEVLLSKIENGKVGDKLTLTICRVDNNYQTKEFNVTVTLVEEKKEAAAETTTSQNYVDPYEFYNDFFKGLF